MSASVRDPRNSLRALCDDYFQGLITREMYRARRAALLDAVVLGPPVPEGWGDAVPVARLSPAAVKPDPGPVVPASRPHPRRWLFGALGVLALAAGGLVWLLRSGDLSVPVSPPKVAADSARGAPPQTPERTEMSREANFVARFLARPDAWRAEAVADFLYEWDALTPVQRQQLKATPAFAAFGVELRERILDERALGTTLETGQTLEAFARLLELDLGLAPVPADELPVQSPGAAPPETTAVAEDPTPISPVAETALEPAAPEAAPPPLPEAAPAGPAGDPAAATATPGSGAGIAVPSPRPSADATPAAMSSSGASSRGCRAAQAAQTSLSRRLCVDALPDGTRGPALVVVPAGRFTFGAADMPDARPTREVSIARPFAIGQYEVLVADYDRFCAATGRACPANPWAGSDAPVVNVSWEDARAYAAWLSQATGQRYRLPTEAEWEYAARAGTSGPYPGGAQVRPGQAIHFGSDRPMARREPISNNPWSLFHMLGNVREWVEDGWSAGHGEGPTNGAARSATGSLRVVRGGSFRDGPAKVRSAAREGIPATTRDEVTGFRVVRDLE